MIDWPEAGLLIDELRASIGTMVGICSDNEEWDGPNSSVVISSEWTDWNDKTYFGDTVIECLQLALTDYKESQL